MAPRSGTAMAATTTRRTPEAVQTRLALAVADANWYTTDHLFGELQRPEIGTLLLHCIDYRNAWRRSPAPWSWGRSVYQDGPRLWRRDHVLPSGWMKQFPNFGMRPIRRSIDDWRRRFVPDSPLALVTTYPHYLYLRDLVRPDRHVYFNVDDYSLYWPRHAGRINALELQAVREADLTVCVSRLRRDQLRAAVPEASVKVHHLPHGTPRRALADAPRFEPAPAPIDLAVLPRPYLGYVGTLEDRLDWGLLARLADERPEASIILIGRLSPDQGPWRVEAERCLGRPNVHVLGWKTQGEIGDYVQAFDACLIPYRVDHPFNLACCPTKIMDYMGSGRPIVSIALPECRLYDHLFDVADDADGFLHAVSRLLALGPDDGRVAERHAWAEEHTCARTVERLLDWLP